MPSKTLFRTTSLATFLALAPLAQPALAQSRAAAVETASLIRPVVMCVRSKTCRKDVADRLRELAKTIRQNAWQTTLHLAELAGKIAAAVERGYDRAEMCAHIDRVERELAASGKLTPAISRELLAIKAKLGE